MWWQRPASAHNTSHTTQPTNSKIAMTSLFININNASISSNAHVPSGTLCLAHDVHSPCAQSWAMAISVARPLGATSCGGPWIWLQGGAGHPQSQAWATSGAPNHPQPLHASSDGPIGPPGTLGLALRAPHTPINFMGSVGSLGCPGGCHIHIDWQF